MKELLEKLSEKMPEGWALEVFEGSYQLWQIGPSLDKMLMHFDGRGLGGDVGLAPLTALLKQSLGCYYMIEYMDRGNWSVRFSPHHFKAKSEFEAVANAYLALKENS